MFLLSKVAWCDWEANRILVKQIGHWSCSFIDAECTYDKMAGKCFAVVWGVSILGHYLEGCRITVCTQQHALEWILSFTSSKGKLALWQLSLLKFEFESSFMRVYYNKGLTTYLAWRLSEPNKCRSKTKYRYWVFVPPRPRKYSPFLYKCRSMAY